LSNEFQIVYISAHWCWGLTMVDGLIAMLDIIYLLRNTKEQLRWELILHWLHGSLAALHLSLILTYLQKYQLIDIAPEIPQKLFSSQRCVAGFNLKICRSSLIVMSLKGRILARIAPQKTLIMYG
jgi:hypothetical protein